MDDLLDDGLPVPVEVGHKVLQARIAVKVLGQRLPVLVVVPLVRQRNGDALVEVGQLTHAVGQGVVVVHQHLKNVFVWLVFNGGSSAIGRADFPHCVLLFATAVFLLVDLAFPMNLRFQVDGQGVHTRDANTVQTSRDLVSILVEFSSCTDLGHDHLQGTDAFLLVHVHGDPTAIVHHAHTIGCGDGHVNAVAMTGQGLVNGVVHDFVHEVVQSTHTHIADVHRRAHTDVFHSLKGLNLTCVISRLPGFLVLF